MNIFNYLLFYRFGYIVGYILVLLMVLIKFGWKIYVDFAHPSWEGFIYMTIIYAGICLIAIIFLLINIITAFINKKHYEIKLWEAANLPAFIVFLVLPFCSIVFAIDIQEHNIPVAAEYLAHFLFDLK